jgi:hypothetical protein
MTTRTTSSTPGTASHGGCWQSELADSESGSRSSASGPLCKLSLCCFSLGNVGLLATVAQVQETRANGKPQAARDSKNCTPLTAVTSNFNCGQWPHCQWQSRRGATGTGSHATTGNLKAVASPTTAFSPVPVALAVTAGSRCHCQPASE